MAFGGRCWELRRVFCYVPGTHPIRGDAFEKHWVSFLRMKRAPLGHVLSRKLIKAWFTKTLPGSPDGYYEFFHYNTSFQHKTQAAASVVLPKESGNWQVSAYRFKYETGFAFTGSH